MVILGIDPGSITTGFGVIDYLPEKQRYITSGCIKIKKLDWSHRLKQIYDDLLQVVQQYSPDQVAIERVFVHKNAGGALKLGQARGAALVACAVSGFTVAEYSPREVKSAVVGYGAADKNQIQQMVRSLFNLSKAPSQDAADAIAIAVCHGQLVHNRLSSIQK